MLKGMKILIFIIIDVVVTAVARDQLDRRVTPDHRGPWGPWARQDL